MRGRHTGADAPEAWRHAAQMLIRPFARDVIERLEAILRPLAEKDMAKKKVCICWYFLLPPLKSCLPGGRIGVSEGSPIALGELLDDDQTFVTDILQRCIPPSLLGTKPHSIGIPSSPSYTAMHPITVAS